MKKSKKSCVSHSCASEEESKLINMRATLVYVMEQCEYDLPRNFQLKKMAMAFNLSGCWFISIKKNNTTFKCIV